VLNDLLADVVTTPITIAERWRPTDGRSLDDLTVQGGTANLPSITVGSAYAGTMT